MAKELLSVASSVEKSKFGVLKLMQIHCITLSSIHSGVHNKCDRIWEKGSYTRIRFLNFEEA